MNYVEPYICNDYVNPYAKKDWERWRGFLYGDGLVRDSNGKRLKPDKKNPHPKYLHTYPKYVQAGYWEGLKDYYGNLNDSYIFHYPIRDCPRCHARSPWGKTAFDSDCYGGLGSPASYFDKDLNRTIYCENDWKCCECGKYTSFNTKNGDFSSLFRRFIRDFFPKTL